ncbi:MAG: Hydroxyethylthiazole kinase [Methanoregula sp. PtaU1.Bin051]|nr:MAG: Hydroxyethylthiazole kinase [Methanoregula sp. PtaU1.Bin051]
MDPITPQTLAGLLNEVRNRRPLVHHITNSVTINDCANITLAIGGAPVMAEAIEEVNEMAALADALVLNIGTLSRSQVLSMLEAGHAANRRGIPIILDPVGAGATSMRTDSARMLLEDLKIAVLKGNAGEIGILAGADATVRGVDSEKLNGDAVAIAQDFARQAGIVVAVSGQTDIVTDGRRTVFVENGHPMMGRMSGTGCMAASMTGAFAAVTKDHVAATAAALAAFGIAGERAAAHASGPYSFRIALVDGVSALIPDDLGKMAKIRNL